MKVHGQVKNCQFNGLWDHVGMSTSLLSEQHLRSLEGRKRSEKEGAFALSDTLPRKRNAAAVTPQFSCATLGRTFPNKVRGGGGLEGVMPTGSVAAVRVNFICHERL